MSNKEPRGTRYHRSRIVRTTAAALSVGAVSAGLLIASASAKSSSAASATVEGPAKAALTVQLWGSTTTYGNLWKAYTKNFPKDAQKQTLKLDSAGATDQNSVSAFRLELTSGQNIPDIILLNRTEVPEFAATGQLANIGSLIQKYLPGMSASARALMNYNGKYIGVPYNINEKLWFYRKDMFAAAGINPNAVKTQAQFIAAGKKLQAKYPGDYIWNIASTPQAYVVGELESGNGTQTYDKKTGKFVAATNPGLRDAFTALQQLRASGVVDTQFDDFSPQWQAALADGQVASVPSGSWMAEFLPTYAPKLAGKWGVTTWPSLGGDKNGGGSEAGGPVMVIPSQIPTADKDAAVRFLIDMFMTKKGSLISYPIGNIVPNVTAAQGAPAVRDNKYFGSSLVNAYKAASTNYKVLNYDPAALQEIQIINNSLDTFLASGSTNPSSALATAQQDMSSQIGNPYKQ
jgi:multiple sugar transport system substrate-binding protein